MTQADELISDEVELVSDELELTSDELEQVSGGKSCASQGDYPVVKLKVARTSLENVTLVALRPGQPHRIGVEVDDRPDVVANLLGSSEAAHDGAVQIQGRHGASL
jgi:hypothetical protein